MSEYAKLVAAALAWARVRLAMSKAAGEARTKDAASGPETPTRRQVIDVELALLEAAKPWL